MIGIGGLPVQDAPETTARHFSIGDRMAHQPRTSKSTLRRLAFLSLALVLLSSAAAQSSSDHPTVTTDVTIGATKGRTIDSTFLGFSYEKSALSESLFSADNTALINLFKLLGPGILRIGANRVNETTWSPTGPGLMPRVAAPPDVVRLAGFLRGAGWKVIYGLNGTTSDPALSANEAAFAAAVLGDRLYGFEIGNEPDLYRANGLRPKSYTLANFLADWKLYRAAIDQTVPHAVITGPAAFDHGVYATAFAAVEGAKISLLTQHYYRGDGHAPSSTIERLLSPDHDLEGLLAALKKAVSGHRIRMGYRLAEANSYYNGGAPGVSNTFASALWALEFCFKLAQNGATGVNFHGGGNYPGYTPIADDGDGKVLGVRPEFYGILLFSKMAHGSLLDTKTIGNTAGLLVYAVEQTDGSLNVLLANNSRTEIVRVKLALPADRAAALALTLTAPSLDSTSGVTLGGAEISPDGKWAPLQDSSPTICDSILIDVPANTAILIQAQAKVDATTDSQAASPTQRDTQLNCSIPAPSVAH
jgi:hypothetical protein